MRFAYRIARLFAMSDDVWARHANPWSVWSRVSTFPVLMLALWSHVWIGIAWGLVAVAAVSIWLWLNPRLFPPPRSTNSWASKAVLGERVWINRTRLPVPQHHVVAVNTISAVTAAGAILLVAGAILSEPISFFAGGAIAFLGKLWFVDRMVWLYEDMKERDPTYRSWLR